MRSTPGVAVGVAVVHETVAAASRAAASGSPATSIVRFMVPPCRRRGGRAIARYRRASMPPLGLRRGARDARRSVLRRGQFCRAPLDIAARVHPRRKRGRVARHRGVTRQGADAGPVPRQGVHGRGLGGPRPRSAQERPRHRRRARLRADLRGAARQAQGDRRDPGGRAQRRPRAARHRPRPRGRGDRLAPRRAACRARQTGRARPLPRDHQARGAGGDHPPPPARPAPRRFAAGAPRPRPPDGVQALAVALGQGQARALRRAGAVGRAQDDLRPRGGDRGVRPRGVLAPRRAPGRLRSRRRSSRAWRCATARSSRSTTATPPPRSRRRSKAPGSWSPRSRSGAGSRRPRRRS